MADNINLGRDKLGLCSETGNMLGESSHTSSCSETDMFGGHSLTSICSEAGKMDGEHSHTSNCSEAGKMDGEHSHTSICSEAGIMGEENYHTCGGCGQTFDHICKLHQHLIGHSSGGSYHYDNHIRTAFPKYDMVCKEMQTEKFNIPLVSKRRKRTGLLDNYDIPSLKKVGRVSKKRPRHNENDHSNANKRVKTDIRRSKRIKENSQTRIIRINVGNLCIKKSTKLDPDQVNEQIKTDEDTIDYCVPVDVNASTEKNDRIKVELEDICGDKEDDDDDEDDNGNDTDSIGQNFENTVKDIHSEDEETTVNEVKLDSLVIEENNGNKGNNSHKDKVSTIIKQEHDTWEEMGRNSSKRKKCNVENVADSLKPKPKQIDIFQCKICCEVFDKKHKMQKHIKEIHYKDFPFICITCSATFGSKDDLRSHRKKEHPGPVHPCGLCDKVLATKKSLDAHYRIHMGIRPFSCDICVPKRQFTRKPELNLHMQTHSTEKKWLCDFCGKAFNARYLMVGHAKNCGGIKPHKCEDCDKKFISNFALQRHRRVHTGIKPYVCEVCGFACGIPTALRQHMRTHTGEKPYPCPHCPKSFRILTLLKRHLVTHTKVKAFVCSYCSKAFTARSSLRTHVRQHTGETPYKCATCGMGFRQNVSLKTHIKSHHQLIASQQESTVPRQLVTVQETMAASAVQRIEWNPNDY